jgi:hypothetical protein
VFYTRNFLLFKATDDFRIGPQIEATLALNDAAKIGPEADKSLRSLPVGGAIMYNAHGDWAGSILMFVGYETVKDARPPGSDKLTGRLTYLHYF